MKKIFLIALLFPLIAFSQKKQLQSDSLLKYFKIEKDKFDDEILVSPIKTISGTSDNGLSYLIIPSYTEDGNFLSISYNIDKLGCVEKNAKIDLVLTSGEKVQMFHFMGFNCQGDFLTIFKPFITFPPTFIQKFADDPISLIRLHGLNNNAEITLTKNNILELSNQLKWLKYYYDNRKKLIKEGLVKI